MQIFIDADGCPVTKIAAQIAAEYKIPCTVICDTAHIISIPGVNAVTVDKGADSVDFKLVNLIQKRRYRCDTGLRSGGDVPFKRRVRSSPGRQAIYIRKYLQIAGIQGCREKDTQSGRKA